MCAQFTIEIFFAPGRGGRARPPRPPSGYAYAENKTYSVADGKSLKGRPLLARKSRLLEFFGRGGGAATVTFAPYAYGQILCYGYEFGWANMFSCVVNV